MRAAPPPRTAPDNTLSEAIRQEAFRLGFSAARFTALPSVWAASERLDAFIDAGYHGDMAWMEETRERRKHPRNMWPDARAALVLAYNYGPDGDPLALLSEPETASLSVYARGDDYHDLIKGKLKQLAGWIVARTHCALKVFVDTAPLMEKPLAQLAGLGWQGKHTNLVSRDLGSWFFIGVILLDRVIGEDPPENDHCGSCSACLDACPTEAFDGPYRLDARKCLSYLTIEYKGAWPELYRHAMGNRVYGCDDCLAACPWNKFAQTAHDVKLQTRQGFDRLSLADLTRLDDAEFRALFTKSPIKRIGRNMFQRNVQYALGNAAKTSRNPEIIHAIARGMAEPDAIVRGAAVWAFRQASSPEAFAQSLAVHGVSEVEPSVLREWEGRYDG